MADVRERASESHRTTFAIDVDDCCGRWELISAAPVSESLSRTVVECSECHQRRVLTVTNLRART